jgi:N-acetylmuramoyl-L-alanine amidase
MMMKGRIGQLAAVVGMVCLGFGALPAHGADGAADPLSDRVIALDPGHGGGAGESRLVPDGRGGRKACNASGTSTNAGYPERAFTWDVAKRTAKILRKKGIIVKMTRASDPLTKAVCVNKRGKFPGKVGAELVVSIHGDGNTNPHVKGFFALLSSPPLNEAQGTPSFDLAKRILRQLGKQGFTRNPAYPQGISRRSDLAGLNHATVPAVMVELGEMRNPTEAALMSSPKGRQRYARALAAAITNYLKAHPRHVGSTD